jgi:aryl-alcohol dehydrogenase-like predicted oxidoreductase
MMEKRTLGRTGFMVSPLCFGVLTIGPLQADFTPKKGSELIRMALDYGVNFLDTAEFYGTYPHIRLALAGRDGIFVATKSYAVTAEEMRASIEQARQELNMDQIPIFLLHEQSSAASFRGHQGAWEELVEARTLGLVRAIGLSTHTLEGIRMACTIPELDVVHPLFNMDGWGLHDGTIQEMAEAIQAAAELGKGVYAMKALAGGHLRGKADEALRFALSAPGVASVAVGMKTPEEIRFNLSITAGKIPSASDIEGLSRHKPRLHVEYWCQGCGLCLSRCPFGALELSQGKAKVNWGKCMVCGYCSRVCPELALKVF